MRSTVNTMTPAVTAARNNSGLMRGCDVRDAAGAASCAAGASEVSVVATEVSAVVADVPVAAPGGAVVVDEAPGDVVAVVPTATCAAPVPVLDVVELRRNATPCVVVDVVAVPAVLAAVTVRVPCMSGCNVQ
jgi:hypothetical protein